ncbi:DNA replication terminus site-binding protein [Pseudomonas sp. Irchel 3E13]|uniref:DNA replication terminus site-binding protein n=1 Tax=Pseudomonas sp. Irchel 3E13 TaxID=2008975 RepID=UPI0015AE9BCF|nr:DNA replication terminus site-binding protein [Pseudomonas sp. Irchel 3E13]
MYERIQYAYQALASAVRVFNEAWPPLVVDGAVYLVPLLNEQKTPDILQVEEVTGARAISLATDAFGAFERDLGQAPGTVMRLPGYFIVANSVLEHVLAINTCKQMLVDAIEAERLEQNLTPEMRPRIMRRALGAGFNTNQLKRSIHAFDGTTRKLTFTWAGHSPGNERVTVAKIRAQLQAKAEIRAGAEDIPLEKTPEYFDLSSIVHLAEDQVLIKHKVVAPHPRCMVWLSGSARWDAMIKANLPVFVLAGETPPKVSGLKCFDRQKRRAKRVDEKSRQEVLTGRDIYLPTEKVSPNQVERDGAQNRQEVASTYRLAGQTYTNQ